MTGATAGLREDLLEAPELAEAADPTGVLAEVAAAPARLREAAFVAAEGPLDGVAADGRPRALLVAATGEAGDVAEAVAAIVGTTGPVPVVVHRAGGLPGWVGAADLVVAVAGPGCTDDATSTAELAYRRGARLVTVGAAGTPLADYAERARAPHLAIGFRPAGTAYWPLLGALLVTAQRAGLLAALPVEDAAARLDEVTARCRPAKEPFLNPAKSLSLRLAGRMPLVWASSPVARAAARRFAGQLAARAKTPAAHAGLPDLLADQVECLAGPAARDEVHVVLFRDRSAEPALDRALAGAGEAARERRVPVEEVTTDGEHPLERLACLVAIGDFTATYLALLRGVDPAATGLSAAIEAGARE